MYNSYFARLVQLLVIIFAIFIEFGSSSSFFTLHAKKGLRGERVYVDLIGCQNLHSFNKKTSSITLKKGDGCIRLHDQFGCQGSHRDLKSFDIHCAENLAKCGFDDQTSSVSSCDYKFDQQQNETISLFDENKEQQQMTTRGQPCRSPCSMEKNTHYFWCYTDRSWDYCSPKGGLDYYGNVCSKTCAHEGYSYAWCPCQYCKYNSRRNGWKDSWGYCSL